MALAFLASCHQKSQVPVQLDDSRLNKFVKQHEEAKPYKEEMKVFYNKRNFEPAWVGKNGINSHGKKFIERINKEAKNEYGCNLACTYRLNELDKIMDQNDRRKNNADSIPVNIELMLTATFFEYAKQNWDGPPEEKMKQSGWMLKRKKTSYPEFLDSLLRINSNHMETAGPLNSRYLELQQFYDRYFTMENSSWSPQLDAGIKLRLGDASLQVAALKKQLIMVGDLAGYENDRFDKNTENAVRSFQERHGLAPDGIVTGKTTAALNIPVKERAAQIMLNMERCKWLPEKHEGDILFINVPEYKLYVYNGNDLQWSCDVVVGKESSRTVIFNDNMEYIVFSPYWNLPKSIIMNETLPKISADGGYLESNNMEIVDENGEVVEASTIEWDRHTDDFPYIIRQKPGENNSLGRVKFLFPNSHSIYLHDTPAKSLFRETDRAFSHGCIRVSEPLNLAKYLLRENESLDEDSIRTLMFSGIEKTIKLKKQVPVYLVYLTAWVDTSGKLNFRQDIYGQDKKLEKLIPL